MAQYTSIYDGQQIDNAVSKSFTPTLSVAPISSTLTFTVGTQNIAFQIGQFCRVADASMDSGYKFYQLHDITNNGTVAVWQEMGTPLERVRVALRLNASTAPAGLRAAAVITITSTRGGTLFSGHVDSDSVTLAKVEPGDTYTVSASDVEGYATPQSVTATAEYEGINTVTIDYTQQSWSIIVSSNQQSDPTIGSQDVTVEYTYKGQTYTNIVNNGDSLGIPTGVTPTATTEEETGYRANVTVDSINHTITALYETEILTISITKNAGDGNLSTVSIVVTNGQTILGTLTTANPTLKISYGINYTCTPSSLEGYTTPAAVTKNWADTTAKSLTFEYIEQAGFVDLGLPSGKKWAIGNLVKNSQGNYAIGDETDWGTYVSWGNIVGHNEGEGYNFDQTTYDSTPGASVGADIPSNDATHDICLATLGTPWHLPTKDDFQELYDNTDSEWVADYNGTGVAGRKFMKKTDHSVYVFFPASGYYYGTSLSSRGSNGTYWSSSWSSSSSAYYLFFNSSSVSPQSNFDRRYGLSVRPVQ